MAEIGRQPLIPLNDINGEIIQNGDVAVGISGELFMRDGPNWKLDKTSITQENVVKIMLLYFSTELIQKFENEDTDLNDEDLFNFGAAVINLSKNKAIFRVNYIPGYYREKYEFFPKLIGDFPNEIYNLFMALRIVRFYTGKILDAKVLKDWIEKNKIEDESKFKKKLLESTGIQGFFSDPKLNYAYNIYLKSIYFSSDYNLPFKTFREKNRLDDLITKIPPEIVLENHRFLSSYDLNIMINNNFFTGALEMKARELYDQHKEFENDPNEIRKVFNEIIGTEGYEIEYLRKYVMNTGTKNIVIIFAYDYPESVTENMIKLIYANEFGYLKEMLTRNWYDRVQNTNAKDLLNQIIFGYNLKLKDEE